MVDNNGKLVANLSASDLKVSEHELLLIIDKKVHLVPIGELIKDLYQPIKNFLHIRSNVKDKVVMANFPNPEPKIVTSEDTMGRVLSIVVENKIHRVFIVDDQQRPTGVISLRDIIARVLEAAETK